MMMGVLALMVTGCSLSGPKIEGTWSEPSVEITGTGSASFEGGELLVYFYVVSQEAKLKNPRVVWKGTAWENTISEAHHRIAEGWEVQLLTTDGGAAILLPISDHVTHYFLDGDKLYLKSKWSYYSEDGLWVVDLMTMRTTKLREEASSVGGNRFNEVFPNKGRDPIADVPPLKPRLLTFAQGKRK